MNTAVSEAKKAKYQYQPWVSDFAMPTAELLTELDQIHSLYYWEKEWEVKGAYQGQPMYCVRLQDNNDPLTSLFIYVDATNGNILGAGKVSD